MKRYILFAILLVVCILPVAGQQAVAPSSVVYEYGGILQKWASQRNHRQSLGKLDEICNGSKNTRVADELAQMLAQKNNIAKNKSYFFSQFVGWMQKEVVKGISVEFSNIKDIKSESIRKDHLTNYDIQGCDFVSCDIKVNGSTNISTKCLFYIRSRRITKIDKYEEIEGKVNVDFSDLLEADEMAVHAIYNFSPQACWGISLGFAGEFFDNDKGGILAEVVFDYINKEYNMTDIKDYKNALNYTLSKKNYKVHMKMGLGLSYYTKYFSIGSVFGIVPCSYTLKDDTFSASGSGSNYSSGINNVNEEGGDTRLFLRPNLRVHIPIYQPRYGNGIRLVGSVGYDYVPGIKDLCGMSYGVGLQFILAD